MSRMHVFAGAIALLVLAAVVFLALTRPLEAQKPIEPTPSAGGDLATESQPRSHDNEVQRAYKIALDLHIQGKWCDARVAWEKLLNQLGQPDELRNEVERNLDIAKRLCDGTQLVTSVDRKADLDKLAPDDRPEKPSAEHILKFYPPGRKISSLALMNITGTGTNSLWFIKRTAFFGYQYKVVVETEIEKNDGQEIVFVQRFREVMQLLKDSSDHEVELVLPDLPMLVIILKRAEQTPLEPIVLTLRSTKEAIDTIDPKLKNFLTFVSKNIGELLPEPGTEIIAQFDELQGLKVRTRYVTGLGVPFIEVLEGKKIDRDVLDRLAANGSLMMDYFVSEVDELPAGQIKKLRTRDVGSLVAMPYGMDIDGTLDLKRLGDTTVQIDGKTEKRSEMRIVGASIDVRGSIGGHTPHGNIRVKEGEVLYSPEDHLVRHAWGKWTTTANWIGRKFLLFQTEAMRNIKLETFYAAAPIAAVPKP